MLFISLALLLIFIFNVYCRGFYNVSTYFLAPYVAGFIIMLPYGDAFELKVSTFLLLSFICFEWLMLFSTQSLAVGSISKKSYNYKVALFNRQFSYVYVFATILGGYLAYYLARNILEGIAFGDLHDYFWSKRIASHSGGGVSVTDQLAYRFINYAMVLVVLWFWLLRDNDAPKKSRLVFTLFLFISAFASMMEGNRSTFIVPLMVIAIMYVDTRRSLVKLLYIGISFILFFVVSQIIFRIGWGGNWLEKLVDSFSWFFIYAFGSIVAFDSWYLNDTDLYWKSYDVLVKKFDISVLPYKDFFIIGSAPVGDLRTNVYTSYAVLYDYMGWYAFAFVFFRVLLFRLAELFFSKTPIFKGGIYFLIVSFPLSIYHEYFITCMYYFFNYMQVAIMIYVGCQTFGYFRGGRKVRARGA